jgi:GTP cyclohydrolase I
MSHEPPHAPLQTSPLQAPPQAPQPQEPPSQARAAEHYAAFLNALGIGGDPDAQQTAARVASLMWDWTSTARQPQTLTLSTFDAPNHPDWVVVKGLHFYSFCIHHMVPFFGTVDIALLPSLHLVGFNALARLVSHLSRRPQLQEDLAATLLDALRAQVTPSAALVRVTARQLCMEMRDHPCPTPCVSYASHHLETSQKDLILKMLTP